MPAFDLTRTERIKNLVPNGLETYVVRASLAGA
jgi:hypothetical protein